MIEILGIQILGVFFALFMVYLTFLHQKRKEFSLQEYLFWMITWIIFLLLVIFPTSLDFLIKGVLDLNRRMDFFIIAGFIFVIGVIFHTYTNVKKTQKKVEKLVRKIALDNKK